MVLAPVENYSIESRNSRSQDAFVDQRCFDPRPYIRAGIKSSRPQIYK